MEPMLNGLVPTEHCEKIFVNLEVSASEYLLS